MKKLLIIIISGVFFFSCGKKGPPVYEEKEFGKQLSYILDTKKYFS